ncbi:hypothetical protein ACWCY6_20470 [Streptomyces sp. 900105755]
MYKAARSAVDAMRHRSRLGETLALSALGRYLRRSRRGGVSELQHIAGVHRPLGREHFVLKGDLPLARFGPRRTTRGIDILGRSSPGTETEIIRRVTAIADRRRRRIRSRDTQDGPHPREGRGRPGSTTETTDPARARHTISLLMQI